MGFIKKVAAKPSEIVPDPVTGNLPTAKPTPKIAAAGTVALIVSLIAWGLNAFKGINIDQDQVGEAIVGAITAASFIPVLIGYFKKNKPPTKTPNSPSGAM